MNDRFQRDDIPAAFSLLTRWPVPVDHSQAGTRAAQAVWAYPLVGAALGAGAGLTAHVALWLSAPSGVAAALALAFLVISTGALHEDGLSDCADGLGQTGDKARILEIMKDSRIGAYGAVALGLALITRFWCLEALADAGRLFWPLVAIGAASRFPMVAAMFFMRPARDNGLAASVGLPPPEAVASAAGAALFFALIGLGGGAVPLVFWMLLAPLPLFWLAARKIEGQTGDVLGGSQQFAEIAGLAVAVALILP